MKGSDVEPGGKTGPGLRPRAKVHPAHSRDPSFGLGWGSGRFGIVVHLFLYPHPALCQPVRWVFGYYPWYLYSLASDLNPLHTHPLGEGGPREPHSHLLGHTGFIQT